MGENNPTTEKKLGFQEVITNGINDARKESEKSIRPGVFTFVFDPSKMTR